MTATPTDLAIAKEGRLHALLTSAVDGIIIIRQNGLIETVNPAAARLFGYAMDEFIGRNVKFLMPDRDRSNHDRYLENYRLTGHAKIIGIGREVMGQRKDGSLFPMHLSVGEFQENGETFFTGIIHDLTARMEAEHALRQVQKIEAVGQLTGGVAHDFNNLLTVIIGNVEFLIDRPELKPFAGHLEAILQAADMGASLTAQLLAFARRSPLEPRSIQLNELITALSQMLERIIGETIHLTTSLDDKAWMVKVDPDQFQTALVNLAVNARDAMTSGGRLVVETRNFQLDGGFLEDELRLKFGQYVTVSVTDTGCGMPEEVRERAFEPFFTTKAVGKGTGLGLSMVYGFTKQSGGEVTIYSEPGKGTTVNLFLPRHQEDLAMNEPHATGSTVPGAGASGETILVVEDNDAVRRLTRARLEAMGYAVIEAATGPAAIEVLQARPGIALVFSDLVMPGGMSGYHLAQVVQERFAHIRVLLTSGYAEELVNGDELSARRLKLLRKPFRQAVLAEAIREALAEPIGPASDQG